MSISVLKTGAIAAALLVATTASSFAATWAYIDHDVLVRANHNNAAPIVNSADEGDYVKVLAHWGNWYKIKVPGPDGWVRANALDFDGYGPGPGPSDPGVQACFWGPLGGYICVNN